MKQLIVPSENKPDIEYNFFVNKGEDRLLVMVGGSGDDKDKFNNLMNLVKGRIERDLATFTFRGVENEDFYALNQQTEDLREFLEYFISKKGYKDIVLVSTSMGAYSASHVLSDKHFGKNLTAAIFIDPADYYTKDGNKPEGSYAWTGAVDYKPDSETANDQLKKISSDVKIHVINFTIRNRGTEGYAPPEERGIDNPELFARLNNDMVKAFYSKTLKKNKGEYIEDNTIPHAFVRDGNIKKNEKKIAGYIIDLLKN